MILLKRFSVILSAKYATCIHKPLPILASNDFDISYGNYLSNARLLPCHITKISISVEFLSLVQIIALALNG